MSRSVKRQVENNARLESYKAKLDTLRQEASQLKAQVPLTSTQQTMLTYSSSISNLQHQNDAYLQKIQQEEATIKKLEQEVSSLNQQIKDMRRTTNNSIEEHKKQSQDLHKQIKSLENKIEKDLQIYNQSIAYNKKLKQKVNELRREKVLYSGMYKQLNEEIKEKREEMKNMENKGNLAIQEKEDIKKKILAFKKEAEKDQEIFKAEWKSLEDIIKEEKKKDDFVNYQPSEEEPESPSSYRSNNDGTLEQQLIHQCQEKSRQYDEALKQLTEMSGISDLDEVVKLYLSEEMQNFSIFNHVSQLSNELERLDMQNAETRMQIQNIEKEYKLADQERQMKIHELEIGLEKANTKEATLKKQYEKTMKTVNALTAGIREMFQMLGLKFGACEELRAYEDVDERNMKECFGVIEDRFNKYLANNMLMNNIKANTDSLRKIELEVPSVIERENMDDDELSFPLTSDEIRYKSLKRLNEENEKRFRRNR